MSEAALIADATGDRWIHHYQISRLETRHLLPDVRHNRTAFVTNAKRETNNLISDPSLRVIVEIGSADACPDDPEQYVCGIVRGRGGLFHDFNFSYSRKDHGFHKVGLLLNESESTAISGCQTIGLVRALSRIVTQICHRYMTTIVLKSRYPGSASIREDSCRKADSLDHALAARRLDVYEKSIIPP
jgi:hypothetical protein